MLSIFLGAGFSSVAGIPLASQLFDQQPEVDRVSRQRLVERVSEGWHKWHAEKDGTAEEYLAHLQDSGGRDWHDAAWYVSLSIALKIGRVEYVGMKPTVTRHNLNRTTGNPVHEDFWSIIFRKTTDVGVLTTNYDILAERGLRTQPRPRVPRVGFHYGFGKEALAGGGYPSYSHIQKIMVSGAVPLLKLHGSLSWSFREAKLVRYHDCRPAIRGDAALVAPVTDKRLPSYLKPIWDLAGEVLTQSSMWIFVGYSLPIYDQLVCGLLRDCASHRPEIHVFDPARDIVDRYEALVGLRVSWHPGLPSGLPELNEILT